MSERLTSIDLPGVRNSGYADYGRLPVPEMLRLIRDRATEQLGVATAILAAADEDFHVETYRGILVRRDPEVLQEGKAP